MKKDREGDPKYLSAFQEEGFFIAKGILDRDTAKALKEGIESKIEACAQQLGYTTQEYLSAVSRWVAPSPVTSAVPPDTLSTLKQAAQSFVGKPVQLKKLNVICKNAYCAGPIAWHQDICYSPEDPYEFSLWVALDDVSSTSAPLEVVPGTHLLPLKPAVDFWSPHYIEDIPEGPRLKLSVKAGDAILFDSRLWHGSGDNSDLSSRYAVVTRWASEGWELAQPIPPIEPDLFGLWTSGEITLNLLSQGLSALFNQSAPDFIKLIDIWAALLQKTPLPFVEDTNRALDSFKNLKILHLAHTRHKGGDATGAVYKTLWETFLSPLENYLASLEKKRRVAND